jgi:membrane fusion protein, multidrug efflux system
MRRLPIVFVLFAGCRPAQPAAPNPADRVVPVSAASVAVRDVPIYLDGLGNVSAFKTVTIRPQVDGRLDRVYFREGQAVRTGEVLAQIDPRPFEIQLKQAEGALARDTAQLHDNRTNLERYTNLREQKLVAQQQVDDQKAAVGQYQGAVQIDEAQIASAKLNLEYARITSPIDGVTGVRQVDPGNLVHATDTGGIVIITQVDPIAVLFTLPQDDLHRVAIELQKGALKVESWSRDGLTKLGDGTLALIDNQINQATASMRLKAVFTNPKHVLWPNQFVKSRLLLTTRKGATVVPAIAVQRGPKGQFVYVIGSDSTVQPQPVQIDSTEGDLALVRTGLKPGDSVVVDGMNQLRPGSKVSTRAPDKGPSPAPTRKTAEVP